MNAEKQEAVAAWRGLEAWLVKSSPTGLANLNSPATDSEIAALEKATGLKLPSALRAVLTLHNGESEPGGLEREFHYLSTRAMAEHWDMHIAVLDHLPPQALLGKFDPETMVHCDRGVKPLIANPKWLPFADAYGDVTRYIDFDPAFGGRTGQVIEVNPEGTTWRVLAPSFGSYLSDLLRRLEAASAGGG